jgi:flavin-dependent dehydrogenase
MSGLEGLEESYDLVIVGAGLSGAVFAEQAAARFGMSSLIIDKRDHIGASAAWPHAFAAQALGSLHIRLRSVRPARSARSDVVSRRRQLL